MGDILEDTLCTYSRSKFKTSSYWFHVNYTSFIISVANREDCKCWSTEPPCLSNVPYSRQWVTLNLWAPSLSWSTVPAPSWCHFIFSHCSAPQPRLPCPALPLCAEVAHGVRAVSLTLPVPSPHWPFCLGMGLCARPDCCSATSHPGWGFALRPGGLTAKTHFQPEGCPFSPLLDSDFIPTGSSNSILCLKTKPVWTLPLGFFFPPPTSFLCF